MSKKKDTPEEDVRFDLLVDDELSEQDRRELLSSLDERPGGWRACALAFLEAQSWKKGFAALARPPSEQETERKPVAPAARRPAGWSPAAKYSVTIAAMAASFLFALWVGLQLRSAWRSPPIALDSPEKPGPAKEEPESPPGSKEVPPPVAPSNPWQLVKLSAPDGSEESAIHLPARERDQLDHRWLTNLPPAMPEDVCDELERTGHHVEQRRVLHPVEMEDGRRVVVPVDQVDVHYVGNPSL
jgi:hypothetical protein